MGNSASSDSISASVGFLSCLCMREGSCTKNDHSTYNNMENHVREIIYLEDLETPTSEKVEGSCTNNDQSTYNYVEKSAREAIFLEDLESSSTSEEDEYDHSAYDNVEKHVRKIIYLEDLDSPSTGEEVEGSCTKNDQSTYNNDTEKHMREVIFLEDLEGSSTSEEDEDDDSVVKELGYSLAETLHVRNPLEPLCVCYPLSNPEDICNQIEVKPLILDTDTLKGLKKYEAIMSSELVQLYPVISTASDGLAPHNENCSEAKNLAFMQLLPTTTKLVSALKGVRAQHGMHPNTKFSVKWAPDVYDPCVTSSSRTVKGPYRHHHHHHHSHRSKTKKDHHSHKYMKGKSSWGSVSEKNHAYRKSNLRHGYSFKIANAVVE